MKTNCIHSDGEWTVYINGKERDSGFVKPSKEIPLGGEFVLGQASRDFEGFNKTRNAFVGHLAHLHIWYAGVVFLHSRSIPLYTTCSTVVDCVLKCQIYKEKIFNHLRSHF